MKPRAPLKRSAIKRKHRKPSETLRIYGPVARRKWMKTLPCSACGVVGYSEGAHVLGNGGMSRKADADTQAPLCGIRPRGHLAYLYMGCHRLFDRYRSTFDAKFPGFDPSTEASRVQKMWQEYQEELT